MVLTLYFSLGLVFVSMEALQGRKDRNSAWRCVAPQLIGECLSDEGLMTGDLCGTDRWAIMGGWACLYSSWVSTRVVRHSVTPC